MNMNRTMNHMPPKTAGKNQRGAILFVALVLLLVLTLIGVTAMQTTTLQERMAGNLRDKNVAFQAAEAALRDCEDLLNEAVIPAFNGNNGLYKSADTSNLEAPVWTTVDWDTDAREYGVDGTKEFAQAAADPRCIVEELPAVVMPGGSLASDDPAVSVMYRVTARAVGGSPNAVVILQSTYRR